MLRSSSWGEVGLHAPPGSIGTLRVEAVNLPPGEAVRYFRPVYDMQPRAVGHFGHPGPGPLREIV